MLNSPKSIRVYAHVCLHTHGQHIKLVEILIMSISFLFIGSKETAFIYSILSAGVVHAVTQSCSAGNLTDCSCDMNHYGELDIEGWEWGGCSDNIHYGTWFCKMFVDAPDVNAKRDTRNLMNIHNNEVGRKVSGILKYL